MTARSATGDGAATRPPARTMTHVTTADGPPPDSSRPRRGRARDAAAHQAILDATQALLHERGYPALTIEEIAARAGVGKTTVYRWWPSRAHLVSELLTDRLLEWGEVPDTGESRRDIVEYMAVNFRNQAGIAGQVMTQLAGDATGGHAMQQLRERFVAPRREMGRAVLVRAISRGDLPANADLELILDIFAGVPAYQSYFAGRLRDLRDIEQLVDLVLHGTTPTRRRGRPRTAGPGAPRTTRASARSQPADSREEPP